MTEIIFRAGCVYVILGTAAAFGAALSGARFRGVLLAGLFWPAIAYGGLKLLIERAR